jgi:hypothetical protein
MTLATAALVSTLLASPGFTLHEWGTFTSVAGEDGAPIDWRPLAGPSDLPSFVYTMRHAGFRGGQVGKGELRGNVRMETPVIYFYADEALDVSLSVSFTGGTITEWYPWVREFRGSSVDWGTFKVLPGTNPALPKEAAPSHYYPAREVDAATVRVCSADQQQHERFLFYRGVGTFQLPLSAKVKGGALELGGVAGDALVFESRAGKVGVSRVKLGVETQRVSRPALNASVKDAHALVLELLISSGLYEKEAKAMLETWRDTWFEEGLRVMYLVPRATTDALLPLQVKPVPQSSVRTLVGRFEVLTDERVAAARKTVLSTGKMESLGRFAEPLVKRARVGASAAEQKKMDALLTAWGASSGNAVVQ